MGPAGPVGLDYLTVERVASWIGIDFRVPAIRRGIQAIEQRYLAESAKKAREA